MEMFTFTGLIWQEEGSYSALCPELDVATQADTIAEAKDRLLEAATLHLEGAFEDNLPYLRPVPPAEDPRNILPATQFYRFCFKVDVTLRAYA